jgi:hypothetical protein
MGIGKHKTCPWGINNKGCGFCSEGCENREKAIEKTVKIHNWIFGITPQLRIS